MKQPFTKMHGLGNDFIVLDAREKSIPLTDSLLTQLSNRNTGIGFDQCLVLEKSCSPLADFAYRIYNADGSQVAQCGNGARCLAQYIFDHKLTTKDFVNVVTSSHIMQLSKKGDDIQVDIGVPQFEPSDIPLQVAYGSDLYTYQANNGNDIRFAALSLGNPHAVISVSDVESMSIVEIATSLQQATIFPESVNVGFMQIINSNYIKLRVYERGAGETLACGSGACAAVVAGIRSGSLDNEVTVEAKGGLCTVAWAGERAPVTLTGPAKTVYLGSVMLDAFSS